MTRPTPEELARMRPLERLPHLFGGIEWFAFGLIIGFLLG